jgi:hypothetical protein
MHAADDAAVQVQNALVLYEALLQARVPAALHIFESGGHGFGLRGIAGTPLGDWPGMVTRWGRDKRLFLSPNS